MASHFNNILETIGNTPVVRINRLAPAGIDLDSAAYQADDWGGQIHAVLKARLGSSTLPQVFVSGEHIGGATDTFDAVKSGALAELLAPLGLKPRDPGDSDPYELLPNWLHKR